MVATKTWLAVTTPVMIEFAYDLISPMSAVFDDI
jgi:hypothetical protein